MLFCNSRDRFHLFDTDYLKTFPYVLNMKRAFGQCEVTFNKVAAPTETPSDMAALSWTHISSNQLFLHQARFTRMTDYQKQFRAKANLQKLKVILPVKNKKSTLII